MESRCVATNCPNIVGKAPGKTFHRFPVWNPALLEQWVSRTTRHYIPHSVLCSDHFEDHCYDTIGDIKHIRADAVPTIFFRNLTTSKTCETDDESPENPQIISVVSLDNLFKSSLNKGSDPLKVFHQKIDEICKQKKEAERRKLLLQLLLSFKRFAINQQKIKLVLNRSRLLRRKMMQTAMMMTLITQQQTEIDS